MSHRREQKEALRREREERERQARAAKQRKQMVGYGVAGVLVIAVLAVVGFVALGGDGDGGSGTNASGNFFPEGGEVADQKVFEVEPAARAAGCELKSAKGAGTQDHTTSLDDKVDYSTNPPTSGRHYIEPSADGVYQGDPPQDEELVHALEHGRVIVWVKPSAPPEAREAIRAINDEDDGYQTLLVRRTDMPGVVAATAWNGDPAPNGTGRTLMCDTWSPEVADAIRAFRDEHRSRGPEPVP